MATTFEDSSFKSFEQTVIQIFNVIMINRKSLNLKENGKYEK